MAPNRPQTLIRLDVSVGSNSEVRMLNREVGFALNNGHRQISRSGPVREESTLKPARSRKSLALRCIRSTLVICNRVREAAMWAASLHTLMLSPPRCRPRHGDSSQRGDETARLTPIPNSRVGFRSVLNNRCAATAFVAQRSSQRATRKSTRAANRS
jgi:hypothetical protein